MPLSWSDPSPLHNGPERDTDAWAYWLGAAPGADPGAPWDGSPAPDGPGAGPAGAGADRTAGAGGHGAADGPGLEGVGWYDLAHVPTAEADPPLHGFVASEPGSLTIAWGDGGAGKGTFAAWLSSEVIAEGGHVGIIDAEGHPREWARRLTGLLGRQLRPAEAHIWHPESGLVELEDSRGLVDLLVVDSAGYFTGDGSHHDEWARSATWMQQQARAAGVPMLVLAHSPNGQDRIYGSRYWHNAARVSLQLKQEQELVTITCHKATDQPGLRKGQEWTATAVYQGTVPVSYSVAPKGQLMTPLQVGEELLRQGWLSLQQLALRAGGSVTSWRRWVVELGCLQRPIAAQAGAGRPTLEYTLAGAS